MMNTGNSDTKLNGVPFSTVDRNNDQYKIKCAVLYNGGWWFNNCHYAFLNGPWPPEHWKSPWYPTISSASNIVEVRMMIKPT